MNAPTWLPSPSVRRLAVPLTALVLVAGACASSGATETNAVASLEETPAVEETVTADAQPADDLATAEDAALAFSACMRDEGLDFPDIGVDADGNPNIRDAFQAAGLNPGNEEFQAAMEVCGDLLADAGFGGGRGARADDPELQDAFLAFSECLRDEGLDVGDFQPGGGVGAGGGGEDGAPQRGQGGGSGDRTGFLANALGVDPDDPEVAAALELCQPILADARGGQGGAGAATD